MSKRRSELSPWYAAKNLYYLAATMAMCLTVVVVCALQGNIGLATVGATACLVVVVLLIMHIRRSRTQFRLVHLFVAMTIFSIVFAVCRWVGEDSVWFVFFGAAVMMSWACFIDAWYMKA